jgi:hypothetical protein
MPTDIGQHRFFLKPEWIKIEADPLKKHIVFVLSIMILSYKALLTFVHLRKQVLPRCTISTSASKMAH